MCAQGRGSSRITCDHKLNIYCKSRFRIVRPLDMMLLARLLFLFLHSFPVLYPLLLVLFFPLLLLSYLLLNAEEVAGKILFSIQFTFKSFMLLLYCLIDVYAVINCFGELFFGNVFNFFSFFAFWCYKSYLSEFYCISLQPHKHIHIYVHTYVCVLYLFIIN